MNSLLRNIFDWAFGCRHRRLSRVLTIDNQTYQVCLNCGARLRYSWNTMSRITNEVTTASVLVRPRLLHHQIRRFHQQMMQHLGM